MKEYIDREMAKEAIYQYTLEQTVSKYPSLEICKAVRVGMRSVISELENVPAVDVAPVVRCKDCQFYEEVEYYPDCGIKYVCRLLKRQMHDDDFCSYGERK